MWTLAATLNESVIWWSVAGSIIVFIGSLIAIPWIIVRLPADYFNHRRRHPAPMGKRIVLYYGALALKNVIGVVFVVMGIAMLVLPGQGLLTILIGLSLIDFPGKYRLERYIVSRRLVLRSLNWLRRRAGKRPFRLGRRYQVAAS